jgi:ketosteroid isomerase-like protein
MTDTTALVQSAYACFGRGDIPALLDMMSPHCCPVKS